MTRLLTTAALQDPTQIADKEKYEIIDEGRTVKLDLNSSIMRHSPSTATP